MQGTIKLTVSSLFDREHAVELGNPIPKNPLIFLKPPSSYLKQGGKIKVKVSKIIKTLSQFASRHALYTITEGIIGRGEQENRSV